MTIEFNLFEKDYTLELLTEENAAPLFERVKFLKPCPVWHLSNGDGFEFSILAISSRYGKKQESEPQKRGKFQFTHHSYSNCNYSCSGNVTTYKPFGHTDNLSFEESTAIEQAIKILNDVDDSSYVCDTIESAIADHVKRYAH